MTNLARIAPQSLLFLLLQRVWKPVLLTDSRERDYRLQRRKSLIVQVVF